MIKIEINNSYSRIIGLKLNDFNRLRQELSYRLDSRQAYFMSTYPKQINLVDRKGVFPSGLINRVYKLLLKWNIDYETIDLRVMPKRVNISYIDIMNKHSLYKWQKEALTTIFKDKKERGGIVATTGSGKSLIIALIASIINVRTLVIVPTLEIKKQLIGLINDVFPGIDIVIEHIGSPRLETLTGFDCLILDECHHAAAKTYRRLNKTVWKWIYYRYFLTATFFRNKEDEQLIFEGICGEVVYELPYKRAVKENYIVPVESYYLEIPKQQCNGWGWKEVYSELVVNNTLRNDIIANLLKSLINNDVYTLVLVKEIKHGEILKEMTGIEFVNGLDQESRKFIEEFNSGKRKILIGTQAILGEGIDTKPAEYIVIAGLGRAKSSFMQAVGRGVRKWKNKESAKIILFKDKSHKFTLRHFNDEIKVLKEEYFVKTEKLG